MLNSYCVRLCDLSLPYRGRQLYMHSFDTDSFDMPHGYEDYGPVVIALCDAAKYDGEAHLTVDEKIVIGTQRRPGAHVDGWYVKSAGRWGGPRWQSHAHSRMPILTASSVPGCKVYEGCFDGIPKDGGDLEHIRAKLGGGFTLPANVGYFLSADCVHESMPFDVPTPRTFVRIALGRAM